MTWCKKQGAGREFARVHMGELFFGAITTIGQFYSHFIHKFRRVVNKLSAYVSKSVVVDVWRPVEHVSALIEDRRRGKTAICKTPPPNSPSSPSFAVQILVIHQPLEGLRIASSEFRNTLCQSPSMP